MRRIICTVTNDLVYDQRMIRICSSLAKAGYEVKLVGRKKADSPTLSEQPFSQKRLYCFFQKGKWFYLEYNIRLFLYLIFHAFDLICAVDLDTLAPGYVVSKLKIKPLIYDAHEYFTEVPEVVRRPQIQRIWAKLAQTLIPRIRYAYTVGDELGKIFEKEYGVPFEVIRNVPEVYSVTSPQKPPGKTRVLLYQGALNEGRGLEAIIQAMPLIGDTELWLAGEGDLSEQLREMAMALRLDNKVRFLGYVRPQELKAITLQADLGLNLLENKGLSYYYSLANKAFDYIQAGIPSLHMNFPEYRHLQEEYDVFVLAESLDPSYLAGLIQGLFNDQSRYQELQQNCQSAAKTLNWTHEEQRLLRFYQNIFSKQ